MRRLVLAVCFAAAGLVGAAAPAAALPPPFYWIGPHATAAECEVYAQTWRDQGPDSTASECIHKATSQFPAGWYFRGWTTP